MVSRGLGGGEWTDCRDAQFGGDGNALCLECYIYMNVYICLNSSGTLNMGNSTSKN